MQQRAAKYLLITIYAAVTAGIMWMMLKLVLPYLSPFILAYILAAAMERPVRFMVRCGFRRRLASGILTMLLLTLTLRAVWVMTIKGAGALTDFVKYAPIALASFGERIEGLEHWLGEYLAYGQNGLDGHISEAISAFMREIYEIPLIASQRMLDFLAHAAQTGPGVALYMITALLGTYFISASFPRTNAFLAAQLPYELRRRLSGISEDIHACFGGFFRAQIILMCITFFELIAVFYALGIKNAAALAAFTAAVDALPVFGTGTVLIPWAVLELVQGEGVRAFVLAALWGGTNIVRTSLQAKLLGAQIGLNPLASLLALYIGWRMCGVWGMLFFPVLFAIAAQLNEKGVIKLWKTL